MVFLVIWRRVEWCRAWPSSPSCWSSPSSPTWPPSQSSSSGKQGRLHLLYKYANFTLTLTKSYDYFRFGNGQFAVLILCLTLSDLLVVFCGILGALILEVSLQPIRRGLPFLYSVVTANQKRFLSFSLLWQPIRKYHPRLTLLWHPIRTPLINCDNLSSELDSNNHLWWPIRRDFTFHCIATANQKLSFIPNLL